MPKATSPAQNLHDVLNVGGIADNSDITLDTNGLVYISSTKTLTVFNLETVAGQTANIIDLECENLKVTTYAEILGAETHNISLVSGTLIIPNSSSAYLEELGKMYVSDGIMPRLHIYSQSNGAWFGVDLTIDP